MIYNCNYNTSNLHIMRSQWLLVITTFCKPDVLQKQIKPNHDPTAPLIIIIITLLLLILLLLLLLLFVTHKAAKRNMATIKTVS